MQRTMLWLLCLFDSFRLISALDDATKPVKLSTRQGLLMNQILATYSLDDAQNLLCKNHSNRFKTGLRAFEPWALHMFDSSSKIQAGILLGNLMEFGSFEQCLGVRFDDIKGKHCLLKITPTLQLIKTILSFHNVSEKRFAKLKTMVDTSVLLWSVCVPASCPVQDILRHFSKIVSELGDGLHLNVNLDEYHCQTVDTQPRMGVPQFASMCVRVCTVGTTVLEAVLPNGLTHAFSIRSNYRKLVRKNSSDLDCLHGLRFLSTCYVVVGHRYVMAMFSPLVNGLDVLDWIRYYSSSIITGSTVCVDTFFLISGLLTSVAFFSRVTKNGAFNVVTFYLYRYFRITPTLGIVVLIYATLIQFFGSGPLWYDTCEAHLTPCRYYWWSTLLHVQSYTNPGSLCMLQTWYLTCDMFFFFCSPIILYPILKSPKCGLINCLVLYLTSVAVSFYLAWINKYEGGTPITNQVFATEYFQKHYITPHTRAPPYIIGLAFGYYLFRFHGTKTSANKRVVASGWIICASLMLVALFGCYTFQQEDHIYNHWESSFFVSCSRSAWALGLVWMIWACVNGYGGLVNNILSCLVFRVLSRISYGVFLLHLIIQIFKNGAAKTSIYFSNFTTVYDSIADLSLTIAISFMFTVVYELPLVSTASWCFKKVAPNQRQ